MSGQAIKTLSKCHTCWDKVSNPLAATCCWVCTDITTELKAEFVAIKHLCEISGWSWDDVWKMVHTTDEVWANHLAVRVSVFPFQTQLIFRS
jgi:Myb/SANT-like DNA-binding domain